MHTLKFIDYEIEAADLGSPTKYPELSVRRDPHSNSKGIDLDEEIRFGYGVVDNILPYKISESYSRKLRKTTVKAAVLENDSIKAVFLTEYGCRLWSLYHKGQKRELLYKNPVLQFSNLAVLNAWFAGGVEWNVGFIGHSPFTCAPMFCEKVIDKDTKNPVLRFYEYERIRGIVYEVDAYLSDEFEQLMIRVRIKNSHNTEIPMYWWSNMAVPETLDTRVITDADSAYTYLYKGGIGKISVPRSDNLDITYSALKKKAVDYFFYVPDDKQKFITALDMNGKGMVQSSTSRLKGRKLFLWGMSNGGRKWQGFLSKPAHAYIEIQAGLARTQFECIPMPANEEWEWLESYGFMDAKSEDVHSADWDVAKKAVTSKLVPQDFLEKELIRTKKSVVGVEGEILQYGSGWGYLEQLRREISGEASLCDGITFSRKSVGSQEAAWLKLLEDGIFNPPDNNEDFGFMRQAEYIPLIISAMKKNGENWFAHLNLGICYYANGDFEKAEEAFLKSNECCENPYALSCISYFEQKKGNSDAADQAILKAYELDKNYYPLVKKAMLLLLENESYTKLFDLYDSLNDELKANGRIRACFIKALIKSEKLSEAEKELENRFVVDDLKEGERSLDELWYDFCELKIKKNCEKFDGEILDYIKENYPVPYWLNFNPSA